MAPSILNPNKAGVALGVLMGGWHFLWSLLVATGVAQVLLDFVFWIHFIKPVYVVETFRIELAAILVLVTASIGYLFGWCFAAIWNWMRRA
jgi:hypothetical protein